MDLSKDWNDNSINDYSRWSGQFVVANIELPKNSLITGFEIHAHTAGVVNLNVRTIYFNRPFFYFERTDYPF